MEKDSILDRVSARLDNRAEVAPLVVDLVRARESRLLGRIAHLSSSARANHPDAEVMEARHRAALVGAAELLLKVVQPGMVARTSADPKRGR